MKRTALTLSAWTFLAAALVAGPARPAPAAASSKLVQDPAALAVLRAYKKASGGAAWDEVRTVITRATISTGGLKGNFESWEETLTGRVSNRIVLGPMKENQGYDGTVSWVEDDSGQVTDQGGPEAAETLANDIYRQAWAYWYPERGEAAIALGTAQTEGTRSFDVVRIVPRGGRPVDFWIDRATHLLDRTVETDGSETRTTSYSDYREVAGVKLAFKSHIGNGEAKYDQEIGILSYELNAPIDEAHLKRPAGASDDFGIAGGKTSFTAPFRLVNNHIYLDVSLDGRPAVPLLFDTGGMNVLVPSEVERMGLKSEGKLQGRGAGEGSEDISVTKVGEVRIGDVVLRNQSFFVLPLPGFDKIEGEPIHGLVGFEVFKRFVVRLDYAAKRATFTLPSAFGGEPGATEVPFTFDERTPQIEGDLDGVKGFFTLDTGSRVSLTVNGPFAEKNGLVAKYGAHYQAASGWGVGGGVRSILARGRMLKIGTVEVPAPVVDIAQTKKGSFANPYLAGNIGGGVLKRFTLTLDYGRKRLYFARNANFAEAENWDRSGMWLNLAADGFRVEVIEPATPAAEAGLVTGDLITRIGGNPATGLTLSDFRSQLRNAAPGTRLALTVRKEDGTTREVALVLRELL